jgi:hypothetical protein
MRPSLRQNLDREALDRLASGSDCVAGEVAVRRNYQHRALTH